MGEKKNDQDSARADGQSDSDVALPRPSVVASSATVSPDQKSRWVEIRHVLIEIATDMANDAVAFDGRAFNGRTVAEYFGNHGAAIAALARIIDELMERDEASHHVS